MRITKQSQSRNKNRSRRGALYTSCFAGFAVPVVMALAGTLLQAALSYYNQDRLHFIGNDVIEQFESLADLQPAKFQRLFTDLAALNNLKVREIKMKISPCTSAAEETVQVEVSGRISTMPGLFFMDRPFNQTYKIKSSQFDTYAYLAINSYPFCEFNPAQGLSSYLPLYRPSPASPTWQFCQDSAIGGVRKTLSQDNTNQDQQPGSWKQLAENLISIY